MTRRQRSKYREPEALREILRRALHKQKFRLDCGHHITFGEVLGNDLTIRNGKEYKLICAECGY